MCFSTLPEQSIALNVYAERFELIFMHQASKILIFPGPCYNHCNQLQLIFLFLFSMTLDTCMYSRGGPKCKKIWYELAQKLIPFLLGIKTTKKKNQISRCTGSAPPGPLFFDKIYKGFPKFIKEKYFSINFQILPLKFTIQTKSA